MDTGLLRKYEKAKAYAAERERMRVERLTVHFDGKNSPHTVEFREGRWRCDCEFFVGRQECTHTMALGLVLGDMLPAQ